LYADDNSIYIGGIKLAKPKDSEDGQVIRFDKSTREMVFSNDVSSSSTTSVLSESKSTVSAKTAAYTAFFNDMLLCDGTFTITMPNITSDDIGRGVTVCNVGTGTITVDGNGSDTFYGETDLECIPDGTYSFKATTTSKWVLV